MRTDRLEFFERRTFFQLNPTEASGGLTTPAAGAAADSTSSEVSSIEGTTNRHTNNNQASEEQQEDQRGRSRSRKVVWPNIKPTAQNQQTPKTENVHHKKQALEQVEALSQHVL